LSQLTEEESLDANFTRKDNVVGSSTFRIEDEGIGIKVNPVNVSLVHRKKSHIRSMDTPLTKKCNK